MSKQIIFMTAIFFAIFFSASVTLAANVGQGRKILYIPIDNRPCNLRQTVEVIEKLGYEVVTPPEEFLGTGATPEKFGNPDELWRWLENNAAGVDAAVISTDAMIYGSLVASRMHELSAEKIMERAKKFEDFHKKLSPMRSLDHSGEVAEYMMVLSLNDLGKAFLEVDKFVSQNQPYAGTRPNGE